MRKLIILSTLLCGSALAAGTAPAPASSQAGAAMEPQVTTHQRSTETIDEYRINNQLYMIKVTRTNSTPYYLIDTDGDGKFDKRRNAVDSKPPTPTWLASRG